MLKYLHCEDPHCQADGRRRQTDPCQLWSVLPFEKVEEAALSLLKFSFCAWGSLDLQDFAVPWLSPSLFPYTPSSVSKYVMQLFLRFLVHIKFGCFLSFFLSQTQEILILKIIFKRYLTYLHGFLTCRVDRNQALKLIPRLSDLHCGVP